MAKKMNDFTKEELFRLFEWGMSLADAFPDSFGAQDIKIYKKVESMIENYCEHKALEFDGDVYGYDCKKCDKRFSYEHVGRERHERIMAGEEE